MLYTVNRTGEKFDKTFSRILSCKPQESIVYSVLYLTWDADETKPRYSPSANQRPKACSAPCVLPGFSIIGSNWLLHIAVLSCTLIGRVDLVAPWPYALDEYLIH